MFNHQHLEGNHNKPLHVDKDSNKTSFARFLPDLLNLHGNPCRTRQPQSSYRQPQQYPSPGYVIPSPSNQYQQAVPSGYTPPTSQKPSVTSGYHVPNLHKPTISSGYTVPNLQKPTVTNGFKVAQSTSVNQPPAQSP